MSSSSTFNFRGLFIDGRWLQETHEGRMTVVNPATGVPFGEIPVAGEAELESALEAADRGFQVWRKTAPSERCAIILHAAKLIRERQDDIALIMTREQGKPNREAQVEVIRAAE